MENQTPNSNQVNHKTKAAFLPAYHEKTLSLEGAFYLIQDEYIMSFLDDMYYIRRFVAIVEQTCEVPTKELYAVLKIIHRLQDYAGGELYERIQLYHSDIQKLEEKTTLLTSGGSSK